MNKKFVYAIAAVIALSAATVMAGEETEEKTIEERLAALESGVNKSSWAENLTVKGDLRYRYEYKATDDDTTTDRHRLRARIGAYGKVADNVKAGLRLASGSSDNPTSTNQTLDDNFSEKPVWIDLAYITLGCTRIKGLNTTFGKMKQPWVSVSDLIFDTDVNPEGIATTYELEAEAFTLISTLSYHIMEEETAKDVSLASGQIAAYGKISENIKLTIGAGAFVYNDNEGKVMPDYDAAESKSAGNTFAALGEYVYRYEIIDGFAKLDINEGPLPCKVYGQYLQNIASGISEDTAWLVGIGTQCPVTGVKLDYNYRDMESDSVLSALADGDFGGPDGKGHKIKATYGLARNTTVGATYFRVDRNNTDRDVLQLDLVVKF